jgi:hypothetical protein
VKLPEERICILYGQGRTQMVWKPRILTPSGPIMVKAILQARSEKRLPDSSLPGEDIVGSRAIHLFQLQTQRMRLTDREAAGLYQLVSEVMEQERRYPLPWGAK